MSQDQQPPEPGFYPILDGEHSGTDRYQALGLGYPDPATICQGQCEGIGRYPVRLASPDLTDYEREQWHLENARNPLDPEGLDQTHFIVCPDCKGTGKRAPA